MKTPKTLPVDVAALTVTPFCVVNQAIDCVEYLRESGFGTRAAALTFLGDKHDHRLFVLDRETGVWEVQPINRQAAAQRSAAARIEALIQAEDFQSVCEWAAKAGGIEVLNVTVRLSAKAQESLTLALISIEG